MVAMLGASQSIPDDAAQYFSGRRCRILIDADAAGEAAAAKWAQQLYRAGARTVDGCRWTGCTMAEGKPVKDANDYAATLDIDQEPAIDPVTSLLASQPAEDVA